MNTWGKFRTSFGSYKKRFPSSCLYRISPTLAFFCFEFSRQKDAIFLSVSASQDVAHFHISGLVLGAMYREKRWRKYWEVYTICNNKTPLLCTGMGVFLQSLGTCATSALQCCNSVTGLTLEQETEFKKWENEEVSLLSWAHSLLLSWYSGQKGITRDFFIMVSIIQFNLSPKYIDKKEIKTSNTATPYWLFLRF